MPLRVVHPSDEVLYLAVGGPHVWVVQEEGGPHHRDGDQRSHPQPFIPPARFSKEHIVVGIRGMVKFGDGARLNLLKSFEAEEVLITPFKPPDIWRLVVLDGFALECHNPPIIHAGALAFWPLLKAMEDKKGLVSANYGKVGLSSCSQRQRCLQRRVLNAKPCNKTPKFVGSIFLGQVCLAGGCRKSCG